MGMGFEALALWDSPTPFLLQPSGMWLDGKTLLFKYAGQTHSGLIHRLQLPVSGAIFRTFLLDSPRSTCSSTLSTVEEGF
ncbi:hypothetical protein ABIB48_003384 [Arthrobacter sp. UYCu511]